MNKHVTRIAPAAMDQLQQPWMGNVRELENAVERAMVVAQEPELREQDFIFKTQPAPAATAGKSLEEIERAHLLRVLEECGGNQSRAADVLDIDHVASSQAQALRLDADFGGSTQLEAEEAGQMNLVHRLPVGKVDLSLLHDLRVAIPRSLHVACEILPYQLDPTPSYHPEWQQYHSSKRVQPLVRPQD